jgi:hypothetical protein
MKMRTLVDVDVFHDLMNAGKVFASRTDSFAEGKAEICFDMAHRLREHGRFASEKQEAFAMKLIEWSKPRAQKPSIKLERIESLVRDKNKRLVTPDFKVLMFQSGTVGIVAPVFGGGTFGVIENGMLRDMRCTPAMIETLKDIEARGLEAVQEIGRATGVCCVCGRTLTNQSSIEAGIGPICASGF